MPTLDAPADIAGLSRFHFHRLFKAATGLTPKPMPRASPQARPRRTPGSATVTEAIYDAGFNSSGRFYAKSTDCSA